ncbi:hypothetical protein SAMN04487950_2306 [Halogranum rubrum]|uniref:Uncharacterized protein n=1 Tax=Halogranum rubrum TaxID=553466 RepID=A0A1I4EQY6_9EURY|nr:hypothetical protein [Halogranum rubrum]SFL07510.1 hypothetical protein SAMN04487950_2306 [Halogranum rubrum]
MSDETDQTDDADEQTTDAHDAEESTDDSTESTDGESAESENEESDESRENSESDVTDVVTVEHAPDAVEDAAETAVDTVTDAGELVEEAQSLLRKLAGLDDDPESHERAQELLDDLHLVADEAEDVLGTINFEELPNAIDASEMPDTVDADELPDAVTSGDPTKAVELRNLNELVKLTDLWDAVDVREFWRNKREFDEAVDGLFDREAGDEADDSLLDDIFDRLSESGEGSEESDADDGFLDRDSGLFGDEADEDEETAAEAEDDESSLSKPELGMLETDESKQAAIQKKISESVADFRGSILDARERLTEVVEKNQERTESAGQPNSRNPTAVSTMPTSRADLGGSTRYSTVPEETRYSTAPNRPRIYGQRFDDAKERTENDDE